MIQRGNELIRINPSKKNELDYSRDNGTNWNRKFLSHSGIGDFIDLLDFGHEILAITKNGQEIYYSKDNGSNWNRRFLSNSVVGSFQSLALNGSELLATTDKGLYYSRDNGANWNRK